MSGVSYDEFLKEKNKAEMALMLGTATGRQFVIAQISYKEWRGMQLKGEKR